MSRIDLSGVFLLAFACIGAAAGSIVAVLVMVAAPVFGFPFTAGHALAIVFGGGVVGALVYWRAGAK